MKTNLSYFHSILSILQIRARAGGLEISDQVLRLVYYYRREWHIDAVRLAPGVMEKGVLKDANAFAAALHELRSHIPFAKGTKKVNVIVVPSSVSIYSEVFTLPIMEGNDLSKAVELNLRMSSPLDIAKTYFGWQVIGRDEKNLRLEISAAFADKAAVHGMIDMLSAAGFITVVVESRALALTRVVREQGTGIDPAGSYLLVDIDNSGIDFLIIRNGSLYFEYANLWSDIADEKGQMTVERFNEMLSGNVRQVMNFYSQHWTEALSAVILSAASFVENAQAAVTASVSVPVIPLAVATGQSISPEWFVGLGSGLRGLNIANEDNEINLLDGKAMNRFYEERIINFFGLWRVIIPVVMGCLIAMFALASVFLSITKKSIESDPSFTQRGTGAEEEADLQASSTAFNQFVALVSNAEQQVSRNYLIVNEVNTVAGANGITVDNISFQAANVPILVAGTAPSAVQISAFKEAIQSDPHFGTVNLPLLNIQQDTNGSSGYSFSMSFPLSGTGF
jgi:Tfp pilus assembly PilM family ATPase